MKFLDILQQYKWQEVEAKILKSTREDVERTLNSSTLSITDFMHLVSPAAEPYLEIMAQKSRELTQRRFGKTIQLYIPLYLSNICTNHCIYCGFNAENKIHRVVLNDEQILKEVQAIKAMGYEHILLLTGEADKVAGVNYLLNSIKLVKPYFSLISAEIQPLKTDEYKQLIGEGLNSVYVYQETYNQDRYPIYHPRGNKSNFEYRLETPERLGEANIYKTGLGALLGLENWRVEAFFMALHLQYLQKHYWRTKYSLSFPRLRPHVGEFQPNYVVTERNLAQLIWAFRLFDEEVEISLSTRESQKFRDNMMTLGVTSMSAGSRTDPGGYSTEKNELEQFAINDNRTAKELEQQIKSFGYEAVWKDWDKSLQ
ncbi:MAG: 2-iminoacetate synthase ThiH [Bacteroidetes bacterium]|nr:2-iminoacetate synthase ThiH [Bacteroidota bacterium]